VWEDLTDPIDGEKLTNLEAIPRPVPPYRRMWLEGRSAASGLRVGTLVERMLHGEEPGQFPATLTEEVMMEIAKHQPSVFVGASVWHEYHGHAHSTGSFFYGLDGNGRFLSSEQLLVNYDGMAQELYDRIRLGFFIVKGWAMHALARMNRR
jgi:hypothetical protein